MLTRLHALRFWLLAFCCSLACLPAAYSFQLADGSPAAPKAPARYIFYWDRLQCVLEEANGFKGSLKTTPQGFRSLLLSAPSIWNGSALNKAFVFKINDMPVNTAEYSAAISTLHTAFGKDAAEGQVYHLSDLPLDGQQKGAIDLYLETPSTDSKKPANGPRPMAAANYLNHDMLVRAEWGREDIYETSNRDFFTETEFWQTIRQRPVLEWQPYTTPKEVNASVVFLNQGEHTFIINQPLNDDQYRQLLNQLEPYRHLVYPGAELELSLQTASYDKLYQKKMLIVAPNDPRLSLRRQRDQHVLQFQWGPWTERIPDLYLSRFPDAAGKMVLVDQAITQNSMIRTSSGDVAEILRALPDCRIDEQPAPGLVFRLSIADSSWTINPANGPLTDTVVAQMVELYQQVEDMRLDSFQLPDYELPPIHLRLSYFNVSGALSVKNELPALQAAPLSKRVKLSAPTRSDTDYVLEFEVPEPALVYLTVFEPGGWNTFFLKDLYLPGRHTARIPRSSFRQAGKHLVFLNTPYGVARQEMTVE
ncbi:MAG: hypothetical protein IT260_23620 [Saprospiraceae bacterium]|nr:hypothetical protein [Saprospiraceae bacterium]